MNCHTFSPTVTRSTLCFGKDYRATITLFYPSPLPLRATVIGLQIDWQPPFDSDPVTMTLRRMSQGGSDVRFDAADGTNTRTFTGNVPLTPLRVVAVAGSASSEADLCVEFSADDDPLGQLPLRVERETHITGEAGFPILKTELATALQTSVPNDGVWNRYNDIFVQARAFTTKLNEREIPAATLKLVSGETAQRPFNKADIVEHLQTTAERGGVSADNARTKTNAFDPFQGKWHGYWRQKQGGGACAAYLSIFQDHDWRATEQHAPNIYMQPVLLGDDSRPYASDFSADPFTLQPERDSSIPAMNAINISTGVIVGAVGVNATADGDGIRTARPHIGFYIEEGKLLWVAEESRGEAESRYSVFYEIRESADNHDLYTIQGFDFAWNRQTQEIVGDLTTKGGQYAAILTPEEAQLRQDFENRILRAAHLTDMRYRRQLEALEPNAVQAFIDNPASENQPYLTRLKTFSEKQKALRDAPIGDRPDIVFIMGDVADAFYQSATRFFQINPEGGATVGNLRDLRAVRDHLANNHNGPLPWGEVNIVVHANAFGGLSIPVEAGGVNANPAALTAANFPALPDNVADVRTTIQIRGCALGQNQEMLTALSKAFGADEVQRPQVRAPRHLQEYSFRWQGNHNNITSVEQAYVQFWTIGYPEGQRPNLATRETRLREKYPAEAVNWRDAVRERDGYSTVFRDYSFTYTLTFTYFTNNAPAFGNDGERLALLRNEGDLDNFLVPFSLTVADLRWRFNQNVANLGGNQRRLTLEATGAHEVFRVQRHVTMARRRLFTVGLPFAAELDAHTLSADLRQQFTTNDHTLSADSYVWINETGARWVIVDPIDTFRTVAAADSRTYFVHIDGNDLVISLEENPATLNSTDNAHPATTHTDHFGAEIPAAPATQPLGENVAP